MKNLLCYFNFHTWKVLNPFAKICTNECCRELQEIHNDEPSTKTWNLSNEEGDYFVTTRKSGIKFFNQVLGKFPVEGRKIKMIWLPKNNAAPNDNVYIGMEGIVEELGDDGSFVLNCETNNLIVVPRRNEKIAKYKFQYV